MRPGFSLGVPSFTKELSGTMGNVCVPYYTHGDFHSKQGRSSVRGGSITRRWPRPKSALSRW